MYSLSNVIAHSPAVVVHQLTILVQDCDNLLQLIHRHFDNNILSCIPVIWASMLSMREMCLVKLIHHHFPSTVK